MSIESYGSSRGLNHQASAVPRPGGFLAQRAWNRYIDNAQTQLGIKLDQAQMDAIEQRLAADYQRHQNELTMRNASELQQYLQEFIDQYLFGLARTAAKVEQLARENPYAASSLARGHANADDWLTSFGAKVAAKAEDNLRRG